MSSHEISLWLDERWYRALKQHLKNETLEYRLQTILDEMCKELPHMEYERISSEITAEREQDAAEWEANRRLAVFRVKERDFEEHFSVDKRMEFPTVAQTLRSYLKAETEFPDGFAGRFRNRESLTRDQFDAYVAERMENTGRVIGAYDVDMDNGIFSALNITDGWQSYTTKDIRTAAYHAFRKGGLSTDERLKILVERLAGKALSHDEYNDLQTIRAVVIEPETVPQIKEIRPSPNSLRAVVGGDIQEVAPFDDSAVLLCNLNGKVDNHPLNRALRDQDGDICDIIAGTFIIVDGRGSHYESLSEAMARKYSDVFRTPERFDFVNDKILVSPMPSKDWKPIYLTGHCRLEQKDISFAEDIVQQDHLLEFYMEVIFDPDKVFGTNVCTTQNDDYVNVYAYYDMDAVRVSDDLNIYLVRGDGAEQDYRYRLTDDEKVMLLPRMEQYIQQRWGLSLSDCRQQYLAEQQEAVQTDTPIPKSEAHDFQMGIR